MALKANRRLIVLLGAVVFVAAGVVGFVKPGYVRYEHKEITMGLFGTQEIRTDRFTGKTEIYGDGKWQPIEIKNGEIHFLKGTSLVVH